jgi:hypothetical protein
MIASPDPSFAPAVTVTVGLLASATPLTVVLSVLAVPAVVAVNVAV